MSTYTVRELFEFSANIRTNLGQEELRKTVNETIEMMGLNACAD